jgi:hypothetical protein
MTTPRRTRIARFGAVVSALAVASAITMTAPASAAVHGPLVRDLHFRWIPGTGAVHAVADITCGKNVSNGRFSVSLGQDSAGATASTRVRCDGLQHHVRLVLDPKRGRFHPGQAGMSWTASGCQGRYCWVGIADGFAHIERPGHARGPEHHA